MKKIFVTGMMVISSLCLISQNLEQNDQEFIKEAADAGLMEIMLGELAVKKATSADVKTLGQHMIDDHTKANKELMTLAKKKGVTLEKGLSKDAQKAYDDLSKKKKEDFDKAYSDQMVEDHKKVITNFKAQSEDGKDADLKAFATKTLPTLQHHLEMSEKCCKNMKQSKAGK